MIQIIQGFAIQKILDEFFCPLFSWNQQKSSENAISMSIVDLRD